MNATQTTIRPDEAVETSGWILPDFSVALPDGPGRDENEQARWRVNIAKLHTVAARNAWSKAELARRTGIPNGTMSQLLNGRYPGRLDTQNDLMERFLAHQDEIEARASITPASPPFIEMRVSRNYMDMFQAAMLLPVVVMVTAEAGCGKTMAARRFAESTPYVYVATMSPHTRSVHGMLTEIARAIGLQKHNPGTLVATIGESLKRRGNGTLLIIDEAQSLVDDAINQLRHFTDVYGTGVAILGNTETYTRFTPSVLDGSRYGQMRSRFFKRLRVERPPAEDIATFITACGVKDPAQVQFLTGVGAKPGAFRQIDMTVRLARLRAIGANRELAIADLKWAWENRDVEGLA